MAETSAVPEALEKKSPSTEVDLTKYKVRQAKNLISINEKKGKKN